ncbi:MAG: hypothetical protein CMH57_03215 [Myxococcales bacterium]|nr:hypothetical protein [Myxococcales bacterium]
MTIIATRFDVRGLRDSWSHCSQAANYLARYAASDNFDPERQATVLSELLNEVLEFAFEIADDGEVEIALSRDPGGALTLQARIPGNRAPEPDDLGAGVCAAAALHDATLRGVAQAGLVEVTLRLPAASEQEEVAP